MGQPRRGKAGVLRARADRPADGIPALFCRPQDGQPQTPEPGGSTLRETEGPRITADRAALVSAPLSRRQNVALLPLAAVTPGVTGTPEALGTVTPLPDTLGRDPGDPEGGMTGTQEELRQQEIL